MRSNLCFLAATMLSFVLSMEKSNASFVLTIGSTSITAGGTGFINVEISSNAPLGDNLQAFGFEFNITNVSGTLSTLRFRDPQTFTADDMYVFGASGSPGQALNGVSTNGQQYVSLDSSTDPAGVTVDGMTKILTRLDFISELSSSPTAGDQFQISLANTDNTFFWDESGLDVVFNSSSGTITITAVPEPTSLVTGALLGLAGTWYSRRRRKKSIAKV